LAAYGEIARCYQTEIRRRVIGNCKAKQPRLRLVWKVGQAVIIETRDPKETIRYLVSAPTMRIPSDVSNSVNAFLAFRATLLAGTAPYPIYLFRTALLNVHSMQCGNTT